MNRILVCLALGVGLFFQHLAYAQTGQNPEYLQSVGTLDSVYSQKLNEYREIYVQLPSSYNPSQNKKYPVAFVLDGEMFLPTVHNVLGFYSGGFMPEMVVVGISNAKHRVRDLTPSKVTELYGMPFNGASGEADNFIAFLETELIPFVESKYPVTGFRSLIGHSYGGLFTLHTLLSNSQLFSNYVAIDPSLDWDHQALLIDAEEKLSGADFKGKSLFVSLGGQLHMQNPEVTIDNVMQDTTDFTLFARSNIMFSEIVKKSSNNGLAFDWKFYPRDLHGTIVYPSLMDGLISTFQWFQMEHTDKFNSPDTSKEELYSIVNYRAEKLKEHFNYVVAPYPEDLFNALGYMSMDMGQMEKAKMFLQFAIDFYPTSANAYDSMADYYERNNDTANALQFVAKAYEISGNNYHKERMEVLKKG